MANLDQLRRALDAYRGTPTEARAQRAVDRAEAAQATKTTTTKK